MIGTTKERKKDVSTVAEGSYFNDHFESDVLTYERIMLYIHQNHAFLMHLYDLQGDH